MTEWTEVDSTNNIWDWEKNKELMGTYLGCEEDIGPNNSKLYSFEVKGDIVNVWGSAVLDRKMSKVKSGEEVRIVFKGVEKSVKTGRSAKMFAVFHKEVEGKLSVEADEMKENINPEDVPF